MIPGLCTSYPSWTWSFVVDWPLKLGDFPCSTASQTWGHNMTGPFAVYLPTKPNGSCTSYFPAQWNKKCQARSWTNTLLIHCRLSQNSDTQQFKLDMIIVIQYPPYIRSWQDRNTSFDHPHWCPGIVGPAPSAGEPPQLSNDFLMASHERDR
jgi:hypothetical protein